MRFRVVFFCFREHFLGNQTEVNSYLLAIFQMRNRELGLGAASEDHFPPFLLSFRFRASFSSQANFCVCDCNRFRFRLRPYAFM